MSSWDLSKCRRVKAYLEEKAFRFATDVRASHGSPIDVAIFIASDQIGSRASTTRTSERQMKRLQGGILKSLGVSVEWIITHAPEIETIEKALSGVLERNFPNVFSEVFVSNPQVSPLWVWLELARHAPPPPSKERLEEVCHNLLKLFGLEFANILYSDSAQLPSNPAILRCLKKHAPIKLEKLALTLRDHGLAIPNERWLGTKLDSMRRGGLLVRSSEGRYALTEVALAAVPTGASRFSSDIERALALGRRSW